VGSLIMLPADTLEVLRVQMVGTVTSFRYPHYVQGFQPTYEMPPPATIYGHICSAAGEYIPPASTWFGYCFTHQGKFIDYQEHLHFSDPIQPFPFNRELLYNPMLTLYLTDLTLEAAFRSPRYAVVLGRSQDLMTYTAIERVTLKRADSGYFEHTLLPLSMAPRLRQPTIAVTMPRYIDPRRQTTWGQYAMLQTRAPWPQVAADPAAYAGYDDEDDEDVLQFEDEPIALWIDESAPARTAQGVPGQRAVWLHSFVDVMETIA
jgi:CRISPR-associated protein Cas5t